MIPKDLIGIRGLKKLAKNATAVVLDVKNIARDDLLNVYAIRFYCVLIISLFIVSLWFQASMNTNILSAPMPNTI